MNVNLLEKTILKSKNKPSVIQAIRDLLIDQQIRLSYFLSRFLEDFSEYQERDSSPHKRFYLEKTTDYQHTTRLLRIIDAYSTNNNK